MSGPRHLLGAWREIRKRLRRARNVALFTDFDGTLVRIARRRGEVQLGRRARRALAALAGSGVVVGVVSGRTLEELRPRVGLHGIWYVGAHGAFLRTPGNRSLSLLNRREEAVIGRAERALRSRLRGVSGVGLEPKRATLAVHYRAAPRGSREHARCVLEELLQREPRLALLAGKKVWELLPAGNDGPRVDKWVGVRTVLARERRVRHGSWLVFYLGDDATDERVFRRLDGVSVAVGKTRHTAAQFFLRSPGEVRQFFERLAQARAASLPARDRT